MRVYIDQHVGIAIPRRFPASVGSIDTKGRLSAVVTNCRPAGAEVVGRTSWPDTPFAGAPTERVLIGPREKAAVSRVDLCMRRFSLREKGSRVVSRRNAPEQAMLCQWVVTEPETRSTASHKRSLTIVSAVLRSWPKIGAGRSSTGVTCRSWQRPASEPARTTQV